MNFDFINRNGHVEVYDSLGRFMFSADNMAEAERELENIE